VTVRKRDSPLDIRDRQPTRCREPEPHDVAMTAYIVSDLNPLIGNAQKGDVKKNGCAFPGSMDPPMQAHKVAIATRGATWKSLLNAFANSSGAPCVESQSNTDAITLMSVWPAYLSKA
jgi:hypothetical protein